MNILFIIPNLEIGGAQSFLLRLISAMAEQQHKVLLYNIHPKQVNTAFYKQLLSPTVKLYHSRAERIEQKVENASPASISNLLKKLVFKIKSRNERNRIQLISILRNHRIQVINSHMYLADLFIYQFRDSIFQRVSWISSFHGCYNLLLTKHPDNETLKAQLKNILEKNDGIILAAERHLEVFNILKISTMNVKQIYYGFLPGAYLNNNLKKEYKISSNTLIFGMVARGDKTKGWEEAIEAFNKLDDTSNACLILTGDGPYLENLSKKHKINKKIIFTGQTDMPLSIIENFDVCILPTHYPAESLPNSIIEYLHCQKPIIATQWAEIPKMINSETGMAGQLISIDNNGKANIKELKDAMEYCINNPEILKEYRIHAKNAYTKFNMNTCITNYLNFFNKAAHAQ